MPDNNGNIKNKESFKRVREILSKNNSVLGKTTLMVFTTLGLLALASPAALPGGIATLGIGAVGIFLDHVSEDKLSEEEIERGVQKIIKDNGLLEKEDFLNYMAPIYTKLLQINEEIESLITKEDLLKVLAPIYKIISLQEPEDRLKAAQAKLAKLPIDKIPEISVLPRGSHFPQMRPNPRFVGHEDDLKQLAVWLKGNSPVAIGQVAAFTGMGGIGKTQLAAEFVHRYGQYFAGGVFWLDFSQAELVPSEVAACGDINDARPLEIRIKSVLADWQSELPRLLIFDNCEDLSLLLRWLPPTGGSRVIVTSRQKDIGLDLGIEPLAMETLLRSQSVALLRSFLKKPEQDDPKLDTVAQELGDLPLALHMAGSYLRSYSSAITPAKYLDELRMAKSLQHPSLHQGEFSPTGHDLDVGRTFEISVKRLGQNEVDPLALQLLVRAACFAPGVLIPRDLLENCLEKEIDDKQFADGIKRLLGLGLVEESESGEIWMHRLVAGYVQATRWDGKALEAVEMAVLEAANIVDNSGYPARMLPLLAHLRAITDQALQRRDKIAADLANSLGYYLQMIADYISARPYYEQALAINRKVLGEEHPDTASSLNNLGGLLHSKGDNDSARPYYEQALAIRRKMLGEEHPDTAGSLNNLGYLLEDMGDSIGARPYYEQALAVYKKVLGEEHPETATSLNNLGSLLRAMGDFTGARPHYEQALAIRRKMLGEEHPDTAASLNNLGYLLQGMGDTVGARSYYEQALAINRKVLGEEHPDTATSLNNLGYLLKDMGDTTGARSYYEQALAINRKVLGEEHPDTATSLNNMGSLLKAVGDYAGARSYYEQALAITTKTLGEDHPNTRIVRENLESLDKPQTEV